MEDAGVVQPARHPAESNPAGEGRRTPIPWYLY